MANCVAADVRLIIDTGLTDANLTSLITLADEEMTSRSFTTATWTTSLKKKLSMVLTAELASMNDVRSQGKDGAVYTSVSLPKYYRTQAEELIRRVSLPAIIAYYEPSPGEEE